MDIIYPVGSIYISTVDTNPSVLLGGEWVAWGQGKVPIGVDPSNSSISVAEKSIGSNTVNISHTHSVAVAAKTSGSTTPGATGAWKGTSGSTTLTANQIPAHTHQFYRPVWYSSEGLQDTGEIFGQWGTTTKTVLQTTTSIGGGKGHTHSIPSHTHTSTAHTHSIPAQTITSGAAGSSSLSVIQASISCYMWKRIA